MAILEYIASFLAVLIVLPLHEFAHAFAAVKCGDDTPRLYGRLTLNPLAHFDIYGVVSMVLIGFGWGKPVPINTNNFRNRRRGNLIVSLAGVTTNLLTAFFVYPLMLLLIKWFNVNFATESAFLYNLVYVLVRSVCYLHFISLSLCVFNLIPLYPLDGFKALDAIVTRKGKFFYFLYKYSRYILLALVLLSFLADVVPYLGFLDFLGMTLGFLVDKLSYACGLFWGLFI